jgi:DNA-binding NtrC family response regulator
MCNILLVEIDPLLAMRHKSILERRFAEVERVPEAADALCLVEEPQFVVNLGLVVCGPRAPGFGGPEFVNELQVRLPRLPVLVLGGACEAACDYKGERVCFLPLPINDEEMLRRAGRMLAEHEYPARLRGEPSRNFYTSLPAGRVR